jgi:SAM-dependent methyltransferase
MDSQDKIRAFYEDNPRMVSSPFGGVDGIQSGLLGQVLDDLEIGFMGMRVLDVGCGRGFAGEVIRARGGSYVGADFVVSRGGFALARADAHALPFANASMDRVLCLDAFEHFPDPVRAASEFRRVLRPGGCVFLSAPNYGNVAGLVKRWCEWRGTYAPNTWAPFGRWQPQEFEQPVTPRWVRRVYRAAGFKRFHAIGHGCEVYLGLCPWTDHPRMPEAIQYRVQKIGRLAGPAVATVWPSSSLHLFWRIE